MVLLELIEFFYCLSSLSGLFFQILQLLGQIISLLVQLGHLQLGIGAVGALLPELLGFLFELGVGGKEKNDIKTAFSVHPHFP